MKNRAKVTIAEVAKLAGVSTATAGRLLGKYGYSSAENREKVLATAKKLEYRPNQLARSLIIGPRILPWHRQSMENLARYIIRASFSQEWVNNDRGSAEVVYRSKGGAKVKVFDAPEWLAAMVMEEVMDKNLTLFLLSKDNLFVSLTNLCFDMRMYG